MPAGHPAISQSGGANATKRETTMLNKTKIALAAALVIGTASTALAAGYLEPGSIYNAPSGDPNAAPACFDAAGQWYWPASGSDCGVYYPTARNAYAFTPSAIHKHHRSAR
jgi:hypothetical protein